MPIWLVTKDERKKDRQAMEEESNKERLAIRMEEKKIQARMTEKHLATLEEANRAHDIELDALEKALLEETKLKQLELFLQSKESMKTVEATDNKLRSMRESRTQRYLEDRKMEIEERKRKLEATQRELQQIRSRISEEQQLLLEINSQGHRARLEIMEQYEAERRVILEAHKEKLLLLEQEKKVILERRSELLDELQKERLELEGNSARQLAEVQEMSMAIGFRIVSDSVTEENHEDYRTECYNVVWSFQNVQSEFEFQESHFMRLFDQIEYGLNITYLPDLTNVPDSFRNLTNELQRITVTADMRQTHEDSVRISGNLRKAILSLNSKLELFVTSENQLDQVTSRRLKTEIEELYQTAKQLFEELDHLIQKFNIPSENLVQIGIQKGLQQISSNLTSAPPPLPVHPPPQLAVHMPSLFPVIDREINNFNPEPQIQNNEQSEVEIIAEG
ncbi:unnamed protein product [Caenorhabditis brenneri]